MGEGGEFVLDHKAFLLFRNADSLRICGAHRLLLRMAIRQQPPGRLGFCALWLAVGLLTQANPAQGELHQGTVLLPPGHIWDFSDSAVVFQPSGDLYWIIIRAGNLEDSTWPKSASTRFPEYWTTNYPALIAFAPQDTTYEDLTTAPSDTTQYYVGRALFDGGVYVVRTRESHYAKLRVICGGCVAGGVLFEYTYQDDGSRVLVAPVPVTSTTWGRIKSLYKSR